MSMTIEMQPLLGIKQAANILGVSERTLFTLTRNGGIPTVKFSRYVRYRAADLQAWIDARVAVATEPEAPAEMAVTNDATP